jgi:hypothetical protein
MHFKLKLVRKEDLTHSAYASVGFKYCPIVGKYYHQSFGKLV